MNLALREIDLWGLRLYRHPELYDPMRDALEDLGMSWIEWLQRNDTLRRLAECMSPGVDYLNPAFNYAQCIWRVNLGVGPVIGRSVYLQLCAAFRVPAVEIEIGHEDLYFFLSRTRCRTIWSSPSLEVALAALGAHVGVGLEDADPVWRRDGQPMSYGPILRAMEYHPDACAFQLRIGDADWDEQWL